MIVIGIIIAFIILKIIADHIDDTYVYTNKNTYTGATSSSTAPTDSCDDDFAYYYYIFSDDD